MGSCGPQCLCVVCTVRGLDVRQYRGDKVFDKCLTQQAGVTVSKTLGGHSLCHLKVFETQSMHTKYEHCTLYRQKSLELSVQTDTQTDRQS